jgi:hypothetical protein
MALQEASALMSVVNKRNRYKVSGGRWSFEQQANGESSYIAQVSAQSQVKERRPSVYLYADD